MTRATESRLIISQPEKVYDLYPQLPNRLEAFNVSHRHYKLDPESRDASWKNISEKLIEDDPLEILASRPVVEVAERIITLFQGYPWLIRGAMQDQPLDSRMLDCLIGNHEFDDFPGLYGITLGEASNLRGAVNGRNLDGRLQLGFEGEMTFKSFCRRLRVPFTGRY